MEAPTGPSTWSTREMVIAGVVVALFCLAYLPGLTTATLLPDELVYLEAGAALVAGDAGVNPEHPPLAKSLFGLAQAAVPDPVLAVRLVAVAAGAAIAVALHLLVARAAGRRWGLVAAGSWAVLPHALRFPDQPFGGLDKLDRYGMLDPVATALGLLALTAAVRWWDDRRPGWLATAGLLVGLAGAAKLPALILLPVVALVPALTRQRSDVRSVARTWGLLGATAVVGFVVAFLPYGTQAPAAIGRVFSLQAEHAATGHPVVIGDVLHVRAPWWASLAYHWRDDGPLLTAALVVAAGVGAVGRGAPGRLRAVLAAAVLVPAVGLALGSVALPHYRFLWLPPLVSLAVLGWRELAVRRRPAQLVAAAIAALALVAGGRTILHTTTRDAGDYRAVAAVVGELATPRPTALVHGYPRLFSHYAPDVELVDAFPADVVVLDPKVTARRSLGDLERQLRDGGTHRRVQVDRLEVWVAD